VSRIYASEDIPDCVVLLSQGGDVTVLDIDLNSQKGEWRPSSRSPLLASYMFPKSSATFVPANPVAPLATLVLLFSSASVIEVCVLCIYQDEVTSVLDRSIAIDGVSVKLPTQRLSDVFLDGDRSILQCFRLYQLPS
jgi:hypothetical protein